MNNILKLLKKEGISYLFFGVLTTIVNIAVYYIGVNYLKMNYRQATVAAWVLAVCFAFVTNKIFVFKSKSFRIEILLKEASAFLVARLFSGFCDYTWMIVAVDFIKMNDFVAKIASNVFVVILNYVFSKLFVFRKR